MNEMINVKEQKALAKYIIDYLRHDGIFRLVNTQVTKERIVVNVNRAELEHALYNAISSWNSEKIEALMKELKRARESGEFYE